MSLSPRRQSCDTNRKCRRSAAAEAMAPDPWLSLYDDTYHLAQEIAENIHFRERCLRNGENPVRITVTICSLKKLNEQITQLRDSLLKSVSTRQITQLEGDRRQNLIDELLTKERQLQMSLSNEGPEPDVVRSSLLSGGAPGTSTYNPWVLEEPEETRNLSNRDLKQQQQRMISEQDAGLDALSNILGRQKQMGYDIGNELDEQNEIIDDLANLVESTDSRVRNQTRQVKLVDKKSGACALWVLIVLLLIAIVVVAVWPTKA